MSVAEESAKVENFSQRRPASGCRPRFAATRPNVRALGGEMETDLKEGLIHAEEEIQRGRAAISPNSRDQHLEIERRRKTRHGNFRCFDREYGTLQIEFERLVVEANSAAEHSLRTEQQRLEEARWNAEAVYEAVKNEPVRASLRISRN